MVAQVRGKFRRAYVATELHLAELPSGEVLAPMKAVEYEQLARYLDIADEVYVLARVAKGSRSSGLRVDGPGVHILPIPDYQGLSELSRAVPSLLRYFACLDGRSAVAIGRLPEVLSLALFVCSRFKRMRYLAFVVADADAIGSSLAKATSLPLVSRVYPWIVRRFIRRAEVTVYVTQSWLQRRFPPGRGRPTLERSNVVLDSSSFLRRDGFALRSESFVIASIGNMPGPSKGQDFLIRALALLLERGVDARLSLVGDGPFLSSLRELAASLSLEDRITFHGNVPEPVEVQKILDGSDIFGFGSRMEGLPRAVIEGMARSLPVVTTDAGGVSELVDAHYICAIDDVSAFVERCLLLSRSASEREIQGNSNFERAWSIYCSTDESRFRGFLQEALLRQRAV